MIKAMICTENRVVVCVLLLVDVVVVGGGGVVTQGLVLGGGANKRERHRINRPVVLGKYSLSVKRGIRAREIIIVTRKH